MKSMIQTIQNSTILFLILFSFLLFQSGIVIAQSTANYTFSTATDASLTDMSGGTIQLSSNTLTDIGFEFWFMGSRNTQFTVNGYGQMRLNYWQNDAVNNPAANANLIVPFSGTNFIGTGGKIHYKVTGTIPNRILIVEWKDMILPFNGSTPYSTFQARLYERTGKIEFVYGAMYNSSGSSISRSTFISSSNTANKYGSVDVTNSTYSTTSVTANSFTANSEMTNLNSSSDGSRRIYTFTPPLGTTAPSNLTFTDVSLSGMTLHWNDNSSNEIGFAIYRSDDGGTTYSYVTTESAGSTSSVQTGLFPNITYYWRVCAVTEGTLSSALEGNQPTLSGALSGTKTIGPSGDYATITAVIAAIQSNGLSDHLIMELQPDYTCTPETFPITFPDLHTTSATTITIRPAAGATGLTITYNNATTFLLDDGDYITIDGRPGGIGSSKELSIINTTVSGVPAIQFQNGSMNNTIEYCNIIAANPLPTSGAIFFTTSSALTGNINNTISNCNIDGNSKTANCIYSYGNRDNSSITISNNNIYDFYISSTSTDLTAGINVANSSSGWTISGNSIYQTTARIYSTTNCFLYGIALQTGAGATISNNYVGGDSPEAAGTWTITSGAVRFFPIYVVTDCSIQGNVVKNLNINTSYYNQYNNILFSAIAIWNGAVNCGNITGNIIGSNSSTGSILVNYASSNQEQVITGLQAHNYSDKNISNNIIGGITITSSITNTGVHLYPIHIADGGATVSGNTVGSLTIANSIQNNTGSTASGVVNTRGIFIESDGTNIVTNNTIANISQTSKYGSLVGIYNSSRWGETSRNIIRDLITASLRGGFDEYDLDPSLAGIVFEYLLTHTASQNQIYNLTNTKDATSICAFGIYYEGTNVPEDVTIERNLIHSINLSSTYSTSQIVGINIGNAYDDGGAGACILRNNIVRLGLDSDGNSITNPVKIYGILKDGLSIVKATYNNIYIGGSGVTGSTLTAAFRRVSIYDWDDIVYNNIFVNARSNAGGTGKHFAYIQNFTSRILSDYNIYYAPGTGGVMASVNGGSTNITTIEALRNEYNTNQELHSGTGNPNYINPTGSGSTFDLHLQSTTPAEGAGSDYASTSNDYDGQTRGLLTPSDIGADAGNFTNIDIFTPNFSYTPVGKGSNTSNRTISNITITDIGTGVPASGGNVPRIWYRNQTKASSWASSAGTLTSGNVNNGVWSFVIEYSLIGEAPSEPDVIQYYFVAQDQASPFNIWYSPFKGAVHSNVNTQTTAPTTPNSYTFDFSAPSISYTPLSNANSTENRIITSFATITDNEGVNTLAGTSPRIYYKKSTDANVFVGNTSTDNGWKWTEATNTSSPFSFNIDYSIINGGSISNGETIQYFVVAQDISSPGNVASNPSAGFSGNSVAEISAAPSTPNSYIIILNQGPVITYTPLANTPSISNRVLTNFAQITDADGVNTISGTNPRIYYKKSTDDNVFIGNTSGDNGWKWTEATNASSPFSFTIDYSIINGGSANGGDVIQYFVVAQDLNASVVVSSNPSAGFTGSSVAGVTSAPTSPNSYTIEVHGPVISYTALGNSSSLTGRTLTGFAQITDDEGVNIDVGTLPRIYFKKSTDQDKFNGNTSGDDNWKWVEATNTESPFSFTIDYSIIYDGAVYVGDEIQYFIVAQDLNPTVSVSSNPSEGFQGNSVADISYAPVPNSYFIELQGPTITYTTLGNTSSTSNRTLTDFAEITDEDGVDTGEDSKPRIYYKKSTDGSDQWRCTKATDTESPFSFTIDYSILDGGSVSIGDEIQYFVVAQDVHPQFSISANPSDGFSANTVGDIISAPSTPNSYTIENHGPVITYTALSNTSSLSNRTLTDFAQITDDEGVNIDVGTRPRIYFKKSSDQNAFGGNVPGDDNWKWAEATNTESPFSFIIDYSIIYGGNVNVGDEIQYFIVAQDLHPAVFVSSNPSEGFSGTSVADISNAPITPNSFFIDGGPEISYTTLNKTYKVGSRILNNVTITDEDGVASGALPRIYWRVNDGEWNSSQTTSTDNPYSFSIETSNLHDADIISYYIIAQDNLGYINAQPNLDFEATDVNTIITPPSNPNQYEINTNYGGGDVSDGGYYFANSTERAVTAPSHPGFDWVDYIGSGHTEILGSDWNGGTDDGYFGPLDIGFDFEFFGIPYASLYITTNGYLTFGVEPPVVNYGDDVSTTIPSTSANNNLIAGCMMDLELNHTNEIFPRAFYGGDGNQFVISFEYIRPYNSDQYLTFQIILYSDGGIKIQYNFGASSPDLFYINDGAVIGIEDATGTRGIGYRNHGYGGPMDYAIQFGQSQSALPVELSNFNSTVKDGNVTLNWETKTEINSSCFEIERCQKNKTTLTGNWNKVGKVNAFGNSNSPKQYSFTDKKSNCGLFSYRLKMIDNDGTYNYSKVLDVEIKAPRTFELSQNYPNPFNPSTTINYQIPVDSKVTLKLFNSLGQEVETLVDEEKEAGFHSIFFTLHSSLSSGLYFYRIEALPASREVSTFRQTNKMILIK